MLVLFSFLDSIVEIVWNHLLPCLIYFIICILVKALYIIKAGLFVACLRLNRFPLIFVILKRSIGRQSIFRRWKRRFFGNRLEILQMLSNLAFKLLVVVMVIMRGDFFFLFKVFHLQINCQSLLIVCCHRLILTVLKKILLRFS